MVKGKVTGTLPGEKLSRIKLVSWTFVILSITIILLEGVLQVYIWVVQLHTPRSRQAMHSSYQNNWGKEYWEEYWNRELLYQPFIVWRRAETHGKWINVDSEGIRKTWSPEPNSNKDVKSVYIFGGSTIWGTGARDDNTIPSYLSKMLNDNQNTSYLVYNYGEIGYTTLQEVFSLILLLKKGHKPDYVIFYDGLNEVYSAYQSGKVTGLQNYQLIKDKFEKSDKRSLLYLLAQRLHRNSMIIKYLNNLRLLLSNKPFFKESASGYSEKELVSLGDDIVQNYLETLQLVDKLSQVYQFKYLCFWQPVIYTEKRVLDEEVALAQPRFHDKALRFLHTYTNHLLLQLNRPGFFNLSDALSERQESYYIDHCHISEAGNEMVARKIFLIFMKQF